MGFPCRVYMKTRRKDRRDSAEEKEQLKQIKDCLITVKDVMEIHLDLSFFRTISNSIYLGEDGEFHKMNTKKRNKFYDTKTFDAYGNYNFQYNNLNIYFFCKSTFYNGGSQDNICCEIGHFINNIKTRNEKRKNISDELYILMLDGNYWNDINEKNMNLPENVIYCNTNNLLKKIILQVKKWKKNLVNPK